MPRYYVMGDVRKAAGCAGAPAPAASRAFSLSASCSLRRLASTARTVANTLGCWLRAVPSRRRYHTANKKALHSTNAVKKNAVSKLALGSAYGEADGLGKGFKKALQGGEWWW